MQAIASPHHQAPARHLAKVCRLCGGGRLNRIARKSLSDYLLSDAGFFPYVCDLCNRRSYRADQGRVASLFICMILILALGGYTLRLRRSYHPASRPEPRTPAVENTADILSNEDIEKMGRVHIPSTVMERLIYSRPNSFRIDSDSLVALKKEGVPDEVILAIVTVTLERADTRPAARKEPPRTAALMPGVRTAGN